MTIGAHIADLERDVREIFEILDLQAKVNAAHFAAVASKLEVLKRQMEQLPTVVARTMHELLDERDRRGR